MDSFKATHRRIVAAVALAATICGFAPAPIVAQQSPPDIRGSYPVSGVVSTYDCTFGGPPLTFPIAGYTFTVEQQEGNAISGTLGVPQTKQYLLRFTGHVSPSGLMEGTFVYLADTAGLEVANPMFRGEVHDGKVSVQFDAALVGEGGFSCQYRLALASDSATLTWSPPDPDAAGLAPPRALTIAANASSGAAVREAARRAEPTGYNVYASTMPGVGPTAENLLTSVPPTQTAAPVPLAASGSFFVVTATYPDGESEPSNEVSGNVPSATITNVKVSATKLKATGEGFSQTVQVFVDGIPFRDPAKVKAGRKLTQKGPLLTGQTLGQYVTSGRTVTITFRNENGGIATFVYTKP